MEYAAVGGFNRQGPVLMIGNSGHQIHFNPSFRYFLFFFLSNQFVYCFMCLIPRTDMGNFSYVVQLALSSSHH